MKLDEVEVPPVPEEVLRYWRRKRIAGFTGDALEAAWAEDHDLAFRVAGIHAQDLLADMFAAIELALERGLPWTDFRDRFEDTLAALGYRVGGHRLRVIFETNVRTARAAGQWARIERVADALPFLVYELGPSEVHRPLHVEWNGTVLPVDSDWWATRFPPNGWGCKCRVRQIGRAEAERRGVTDPPPAGEAEPGWARNPGLERLPEKSP